MRQSDEQVLRQSSNRTIGRSDNQARRPLLMLCASSSVRVRVPARLRVRPGSSLGGFGLGLSLTFSASSSVRASCADRFLRWILPSSSSCSDTFGRSSRPLVSCDGSSRSVRTRRGLPLVRVGGSRGAAFSSRIS
eukprot:7265254-Prymnesium_polylepis.1